MSGFNADSFLAARYEARTESVALPALAEFFGEGEVAEFVVRGLTASEVQRANEAGTRQNALDGVAKAIAGQKDQVDLIRKALGLSQDTPGEVARRMDMLVFGCMTPKLTHAVAAKLAEVFPIEFFDLTNRIVKLSGQGGNRVKPAPSS